MNYFLYFMIFIMGTFFGSFFSLAVYRIPRKENITYIRSHCTTCNHKLNFLDLIPVFSYIFLDGKCRYCKDKIRPRYILLEITTGLVFLLMSIGMNISIFSKISEFLLLFINFLFVTGIYLIGGINKENNYIPKGLIIYLAVISLIKILFSLICKEVIISNIIGLIVVPMLILLIKNKIKIFSYNDIFFISIIGLFTGVIVQVLSLMLSLIIYYITNKKSHLPIGFCMSVCSIVLLIIYSFISHY